MMRISSSPNRPPSPACGFRPATAMRGAAWPQPPRRDARCAASRARRRRSRRSIASRSETWIVTSTVRSSSLASIMRTGPAPGPGLQHLGVAGEGHAGGGQRLLVDRRGDDGRHLAGHRQRRPPGGCRPPPPRRRAHRPARAARPARSPGKPARGQHRHAAGRAVQRLGRALDPRHREHAAGELAPRGASRPLSPSTKRARPARCETP